LISNLITKYSNIEGGLNLDVNSAPWVGALTIAGLPPEGLRALNRFYDSGTSPNPSTTNPIFVNGVLGMIDYSDPSKQWKIWEPIPTPENPTPIQGQGTPYPKAPAKSSAAAPRPGAQQPVQQAPAREVAITLRSGADDRAARSAEASAAKASRDREDAARKAERMKAQSGKQAEVQRQQATADRNNIAFRLYRSGEITEEQFKEELRRSKAGEPSLLEVSR